MRRARASWVLPMLIAAFVILVAHIGTPDHSMHLAMMGEPAVVHSPMTSAAEGATMAPNDVHTTVDATPVMPMGGAPRQTHGTSMAMVCEVLALFAVVGAGLRRQLRSRCASVAHRSAIAGASPGWTHRSSRPARPPGLAVLCVMQS